jgi:hypothetical protein
MCRCDNLPSVQQLSMSSDRAMLALLDLSLELTARSLRAEHPALEEQAFRGSSAEPPVTHEALAASIVILATTLREVIAGYCDCLDHIFGDRQEDDSPF